VRGYPRHEVVIISRDIVHIPGERRLVIGIELVEEGWGNGGVPASRPASERVVGEAKQRVTVLASAAYHIDFSLDELGQSIQGRNAGVEAASRVICMIR
jgi:hypothetical protein